MYQMKEENDVSAVEISSFREKQVIAVKEEAQDAKVSRSSESKIESKWFMLLEVYLYV